MWPFRKKVYIDVDEKGYGVIKDFRKSHKHLTMTGKLLDRWDELKSYYNLNDSQLFIKLVTEKY